jgi:ParB family transcriptional regulator, chromosome partitioning protein
VDRRTPSDKPRGRQALGRGLDALISSAGRAELREIEVERIEPNPDQPRQFMSPATLTELANSIREHGIVQPLVVGSIGDDRYRIIIGERRWRAAREVGLARVPVIVKETTKQQTLELALIENLQRSDLNPMEEAEAYRRLVDDFGLSQGAVAQKVGKSRTTVTNTLRLLTLPASLKAAVMESRISEGHARALLGLVGDNAQVAALQVVERKQLNVRQTEELVRGFGASPRRRIREISPDLQDVETRLRRALGTKVTVRPGRKGGRVIIEYFSDEEFQGLYERLCNPGNGY